MSSIFQGVLTGPLESIKINDYEQTLNDFLTAMRKYAQGVSEAVETLHRRIENQIEVQADFYDDMIEIIRTLRARMESLRGDIEGGRRELNCYMERVGKIVRRRV